MGVHRSPVDGLLWDTASCRVQVVSILSRLFQIFQNTDTNSFLNFWVGSPFNFWSYYSEVAFYVFLFSYFFLFITTVNLPLSAGMIMVMVWSFCSIYVHSSSSLVMFWSCTISSLSGMLATLDRNLFPSPESRLSGCDDVQHWYFSTCYGQIKTFNTDSSGSDSNLLEKYFTKLDIN